MSPAECRTPVRQAPDQIALPLDWPQAAEEDRFLVSRPTVRRSIIFVDWSLWPVKATLLTGPRRSGRRCWRGRSARGSMGTLIDRAESHDEEALFHAWNAAQESKRPLVMIVDEVPPAWDHLAARPVHAHRGDPGGADRRAR